MAFPHDPNFELPAVRSMKRERESQASVRERALLRSPPGVLNLEVVTTLVTNVWNQLIAGMMMR
jgi:hypothetical protein